MISIICPTYQSADTLPALIESVLRQTSSAYELIIIDGASTDNTLNILNTYANRLRYISEPDHGIYHAMNKGIAMARGTWLYFIGADDTLYDSSVIEKIDRYCQTTDADMLLCDVMLTGQRRVSSRFSWATFLHNTIHHQGCIYRKGILLQRPYDTSYKVMADYDLNLFLWRSNCKILSTDIIFANHALRGVSATPRLLNYKEEIHIRNRYITSTPLKPLKPLLALLSYMKMCYKRLTH